MLGVFGSFLLATQTLIRKYTQIKQDLKIICFVCIEELQSEYLEKYLALTNQDYPENWEFYLAYNMFRLAAILQGIKGRVRDGTASSSEAERLGNLVHPIAKAGCSLIDKL